MQTKRLRLTYILSDFLAASLAWCVFNVIRFYTIPSNSELPGISAYFSMPTIIIGQIAFPLMMVCIYAISGYYNSVFFKSRLEDILNALSTSLVGAIAIFFIAIFNDDIFDRLSNLEMIAIVWGLIGGFTSIERVIITKIAATRIWNRAISFPTIVFGLPDKAASLAKDLECKYRQMGFSICAFATPRAERPQEMDLPAYDIKQAKEIAASEKAASYIIIPDGIGIEQTMQAINALLPSGKSVYVTPGSYHFLASKGKTSSVAGEVLIDISKSDIPELTRNLKFLGDIAASAIALVALAPVYAVIATLIKLDSKGPAIFKQTRIGYKKKPFEILKFRTMRTDAEADGPALSSADDPRITPLGRTLRKYRLDELPQFLNVLKGEMSIVGPRPEREFYLKQIVERAPQYNLVHQVRPGITSWGMVKYGYAQNLEQMLQRIKYDLVYVENVSFAVDVKILFYTISTVLTGKGV
ncbi:MAG: sugar transferase [Clostridium sp.]|nr:sugar transferase [Clostridium sp.]